MNDDKDVNMQKRIFFVGTIFGVIVGILGNLLVTSGFELAHYLTLTRFRIIQRGYGAYSLVRYSF
jgi:hypothetical protein